MHMKILYLKKKLHKGKISKKRNNDKIEMTMNFEILGLFTPRLRHFTPFYANSPVVTKVSS